jgi:hypothetical protein
MITWHARHQNVCVAFATLLAACRMAAGQTADPLPADSDARLGRQIGRMQRGSNTILLYERGDIVVSRENTNPPAKRQPPNTKARPGGMHPTVKPPAIPRSEPIDLTPTTQPARHTTEPDSVTPTAAKPTPPGDITDAISGLIANLADPDRSVRRQAQQALVARGDAAVIERLITLLSSTEAPAHSHAAAAHILGELKAPNAVTILAKQLIAEDFGARVEAAAALGAIGEPAAAPALIKAVKRGDNDPTLRCAIYRALGAIDNKIAIRPLMIWLRRERDTPGQIEAAAALDRLTGQAFGDNNTKRMAWLQANHPEWIANAPDTEVDRRYVSIMRMVAAGTLVGAGVVILMFTR